MEVYLINKETNEVIQTYTDVQHWGYNFVEYLNNGRRAKFYCGENEYFTDKEVIVEETENNEQ